MSTMRSSTNWLMAVALCALGASAPSGDPPPGPARLMPLHGEPSTDLIESGDTLLDIAYAHRLPFELVSRANPGVDPWIPLAGTIVVLPTQMILPDAEPKGLVLNLPEMRLYDFSVEPMEVFAAAIGDLADPSLHGKFRIGAKRKNPDWHVPASLRAEHPELPAAVRAGPDTPLGSRWMTIGNTSYGIHGTNIRWSIGRMATHGCVRLYEDEIQRLYDRTPTGTPLQIVYQTVKWGVQNGIIYVEVHPDLYERHSDRIAEATRVPRELGILSTLDLEQLRTAIEQTRGVPIAVGRLREPPPETATSTPTS